MKSLSPRSIAAFATLLAGLIASPVATAQTGPLKDQLAGTWKLVSWKIHRSNGEIIDPPNWVNPSGWIMYHPDGHMCATISGPERPKFASGNALGGTPQEIKAAFEGFVGYCGTYEINEKERFVTHHVHLSWFPNWIGTDQKRFFEIAGNRVTISTPPLTVYGESQVHRLIWERMK